MAENESYCGDQHGYQGSRDASLEEPLYGGLNIGAWGCGREQEGLLLPTAMAGPSISISLLAALSVLGVGKSWSITQRPLLGCASAQGAPLHSPLSTAGPDRTSHSPQRLVSCDMPQPAD